MSVCEKLLYGAALIALMSATVCAAETTNIHFAFIGERGSSAHRGALQGLKEANAQGKFLGLSYDLVTVDDAAQAAALDVVAVVAAISPLRLVKAANDHSALIFFNPVARDDELREECLPNLLHTAPSFAMQTDALQQWARKQPGSAVTAQAWHHRFRKYAAAQLNRRYSESFDQAMDDDAWAGWAAIKLVSDTIARLKHTDGEVLLKALHGDLAFDGQKGINMSFRDTGQLRQPLLLVGHDEIVGEAPVRGIVSATNLDSLGLSNCPK